MKKKNPLKPSVRIKKLFAAEDALIHAAEAINRKGTNRTRTLKRAAIRWVREAADWGGV